MRKSTVLLILLLSLLCAACKVSQKSVQTNPQKKASVEANSEQKSEQQLPEAQNPSAIKTGETTAKEAENRQVQIATEPYTWVSFRGKANIKLDDRQYSCNYYYVNRIDSIIYINVNVFGIEVARMVATPKEVIFVNKLEYTYYKGDYSFVERHFKIKADFYTLQAVFNGWEDQLKDYNDIKFTYKRCTLPELNRPFFTEFEVEMNEGQRKGDVDVTNVKFNVPGPTGIKIPESFKPMK